jgi:Lipase (class 3)
MAPIVGVACDQTFPQAEVRLFSFGGQSPGNQAFADWYGETFPNQKSRFINDIDIIPMWYANLDEMMRLYGGCPWYIRELVESITNRNEYVALANERHFIGVPYRLPGSQWFPWEIQASRQHEHLYYMHFTGVGTDVIQRRFNPQWIPPPG